VREYIAWDTFGDRVEVHRLHAGAGGSINLSQAVFQSTTFPGLVIDFPRLRAGALREALHTLEDGLKSPGHAAFVARLTG
jgi:hypothetical protein